MKNDYFQFKQFMIRQDQCAMKVCTDACLFGAWVAQKVQTSLLKADTILDIGAGSGLLSLMMAQKTHAVVDAIETDEHAYRQATTNAANSTWKNRINLIHADVKEFAFQKKYDLIISNPPFYENDLPSLQQENNIARHSSRLTLHQLMHLIANHAALNGCFAVLLPYHRTEYFVDLACSFNYHLHSLLLVRHSPLHPYFRSMLIFSNQPSFEPQQETMAIKKDNKYTDEFTRLLKDYYLYL